MKIVFFLNAIKHLVYIIYGLKKKNTFKIVGILETYPYFVVQIHKHKRPPKQNIFPNLFKNTCLTYEIVERNTL